jgi:hypothetical protein
MYEAGFKMSSVIELRAWRWQIPLLILILTIGLLIITGMFKNHFWAQKLYLFKATFLSVLMF